MIWLAIICVTYAYGYVQFVEIKISSFSHSWLNKSNTTGAPSGEGTDYSS
jgi:hypothetical protein